MLSPYFMLGDGCKKIEGSFNRHSVYVFYDLHNSLYRYHGANNKICALLRRS